MTLAHQIPSRPAVALAALLTVAVLVVGCATTDDIPPQERRAQSLNRVIMCPVCPGESIDQSQHPLSLQMRDIVLEKLDAGWTDAEVRGFFVDRYGPSVLLEPPREGFNILVWLLPPLGLVLGLVALFTALRLMSSRRTGESVPATARLSDADRARYFPRIEAYEGLDDMHDAVEPSRAESERAT